MKYKKNPAETILIVQPGSTFYLCLRKKGLHILFPKLFDSFLWYKANRLVNHLTIFEYK